MGEQRTMRFDGLDDLPLHEATYQRAVRALRRGIEGHPEAYKGASYALDVSHSNLHHCLDQRDRHGVSGRRLVRAIIYRDKHGGLDGPGIANEILEPIAMRAVPVSPGATDTAEAELARLKRAMTRCLAPELRSLIYDLAARED